MKNVITNYRTIILVFIGILLSLSLLVSYGYFVTSGKQTEANIIRVNKCLSVKIINESDSLILDKEYPITDINGLDKTPYTFTIQNECDEATSYAINLESLNKTENSLDANYVKVALASDTNENIISILSDNKSTTKYVKNSYEAYNLYTGILPANSTKDFEFREWIDYDTTKEQASKVFESKINVVANPNLEVQNLPEIKYNKVYNNLVGNIKGSATTAKYCFTENNVCEPNINLSITNNQTTLKITEENNEKMMCTSLNDNKTVCTKRISADLIEPAVTAVENINGTNPLLTITSNETGTYCINTSDIIDDINNCVDNGNITQDISVISSPLPSSNTYYVHVMDESGNIGISSGVNISVITAKQYIRNNSKIGKGAPNFSKVSYSTCDTSTNSDCETTVGLYSTYTDSGRTYYYRGNVNDNYLEFANYYWRIIRINENGSLRLIYQTIAYDKNGNKNTDFSYKNITFKNSNYSGNTQFNSDPSDYYHVGFMYTTEKQRISSSVKKVLDQWYKENLTKYDQYMDIESGFCGDRNVCDYPEDNNIFPAYEYSTSCRLASTQPEPNFDCVEYYGQPGDLYTVENDSDIGNEALSYPIGLITADEVSYAGGVKGVDNKSYYLYTGNYYWTISPQLGYIDSSISTVFAVDVFGKIAGVKVKDLLQARPVINLSSNVQLKGNGTIATPYEVVGINN